MPLRGLAMVLIAVAVLLGLWGIYALTSENNKDDAADAPATSAAPSSRAPAASAPAAPPSGQPPASTPASSAKPSAPGAGDRGGSDAARGGGQNGVHRINVLNNSTVPELAAQVSDKFKKEGSSLGEVGNLPGDVLTVPQNTVFFHPGNPDIERKARELADRVGGVAREYDPALPKKTAGEGDLTLVLANPVQL
ncbi:hypothetical protein CATYP_09210 [Corynebacterium atypicum]|uniref:LytR/CpsA/Psr regulator C-terminal domain-containing protein n=1 Tax=Corynebacterium atypicum TaxID=191610 RepID=A0ABM5QPC2_9CORY|nr:hypothetical protein CATYP_09210 [Corynebacterium atypicum]